MRQKVAVIIIIVLLAGFWSCQNGSVLDRSTTMWAPYVEWNLTNETFEGNPFDVFAKAKFTHAESGKQNTSEMFYSGDSIWKFRFTGTKVGEWTFETESDDPELNGETGRIFVSENDNPEIKGLLTHVGNQFAIQTGNDGKLEAHRFMVYMDGTKYRMIDLNLKVKAYNESPFFDFKDPAKFQDFLNDAKKNGFETVFIHIGHPHVWTDGTTVENGKNPRLETFEILEKLIVQAHQQGMRVHLWMWGDQMRKATPINFKGGINGEEDKRLLRYIASRLGPLPGWSVGYGFDLFEWAGDEETNEWATYLHKHFGWDHLIAARGIILKGKNNINSYDGFGREGTFCTSNHGPKDFQEVFEDMLADTQLPHLYEERHSYLRPGFQLDMDGTRQLVWWQMMAGGLGGWYGHYPEGSSAYVDYPYPNSEQLRTAKKFWDNYVVLGMKATIVENSYSLTSADKKQMIVYSENTTSLNLDMSDYIGTLSLIGIDTKKEFQEIVVTQLGKDAKEWVVPYESDWAIAIGYDNK